MAEINYTEDDRRANIKVIGVGGGGGNAVNRMIDADVRMVDFIALNTDAQDLRRSQASNRVQLGETLTKGLGAGSDPEKGAKAAYESEAVVKEILADTDLLFIAAGMGGGTGTGAAPVVAELARKHSDALIIGVVTRPFNFEGESRSQLADSGILEMRKFVDTLLVVPNDRLLKLAGRQTTDEEAYRMADDVLRQSIQGIADVINIPGTQNVDFQDVRKIMEKAGEALIGVGEASGDGRHITAAKQALQSSLLENAEIAGAKGILVNFTADKMLIDELRQAMDYIRESANPDVFIKFGKVTDPGMGEKMRITVIAAGFPNRGIPQLGLRMLRANGKIKRSSFSEDLDRHVMDNPVMEQDKDFDSPAFVRRKNIGQRLK